MIAEVTRVTAGPNILAKISATGARTKVERKRYENERGVDERELRDYQAERGG